MLRRLVVSITIVSMLVLSPLAVAPASATTGFPTVAVPASASVDRNASVVLSPITVTDNGVSSVQVDVVATHGTVTLASTSGLTFITGNGTTNTEVQFTATPTAAQTALSGLTFTPTTGYAGSASLSYTIAPNTGLYDSANGHIYEYINNGSNITWTAARAAALAARYGTLHGYLANITSAAEQSFVNSKLNGQGWFGATDDPTAGGTTDDHWVWADGPEAGTNFYTGRWNGGSCVVGSCSGNSGAYTDWNTGEPNAANGTESYAQFLNGGAWNDLDNTSSISNYLVEFGGQNGDVSPADTETTAITVNTTVPAAPTGVSTTASNGQLAVNWTAPDNGGVTIDNYKVEYSTDGTVWNTASTSATSGYVITGLTNGTAYQVRVSAHNTNGYGATGASSGTPITTATAPQSLAASVANTSSSITWTAPTSNGGSTITGYKVEYSSNGGSTYTTAGNSTTSPYSLTGLSNGTTYTVRVSATNGAGTGATTTTTVKPGTTPTAPQGVAAASGDSQSIVTWTAPTSDGGHTIVSYKVEYSTNGTIWTTASTNATSPYTLTGLTNGTAYQVRVTAVNDIGGGSATTAAVTPLSVPGAPSNLTAVSGPAQATISWSTPTNIGGSAPTAYKLEYSSNNGVSWATISNSAVSPYTIVGLTNGSVYQVRVSATNVVGTGATASTSVSPATIPGAPTITAIATTTTSGTFTWTPPANTGGTVITGYKVEYKLPNATAWSVVAASTTSPSTISGLSYSTTYSVRITALNSVGAGGATTASFTTATPPVPGTTAGVHLSNDGTVTTVPVGLVPAKTLVVTASNSTGTGSWSVTPDGGVYVGGNASFFGSMGGKPLAAPATGITPTSDNDGYYVVGADGGVFAFGDATFKGSLAGTPLNSPIKSLTTSCNNNGYYLVAGDGGVFAFGDAQYAGSMAGKPLNQGMLGVVDSCSTGGYYTFAADGGVFAFGGAQFYGSLGNNPPAGGIVGMVGAPDGKGYWLIGKDGHTYGFGSAAS